MLLLNQLLLLLGDLARHGVDKGIIEGPVLLQRLPQPTRLPQEHAGWGAGVEHQFSGPGLLCGQSPFPRSLGGPCPGWHLFLLLPGQFHLLLLLLKQHGSHVLLLGVGCEELVPKGGQLVNHDQKLKLLLSQALLGPCSQ